MCPEECFADPILPPPWIQGLYCLPPSLLAEICSTLPLAQAW